ncbi:hypothetical protein [Streptomyces sp. NPDC055058]
MTALNLAAIIIGLLAVLLLLCGLPGHWYYGLLALACLVGSMAQAYKEHRPTAIGLLAVAALMAVASLATALRDGRGRT